MPGGGVCVCGVLCVATKVKSFAVAMPLQAAAVYKGLIFGSCKTFHVPEKRGNYKYKKVAYIYLQNKSER